MNPLYAQINPESTLEDIKTLLAGLQEKVAAKDNSEDDTGVEEQPFDPAIQSIIDGLTVSVDQLSVYIDKVQSQQDKTWLQQIKDEASREITTYKQAYDATMYYDKGWFSRLFLSVEAKVDLAGYLLTVLQPLCNSNLDTLQMISNRDPDIILYITWPREST
jgi:hypothetical protein